LPLIPVEELTMNLVVWAMQITLAVAFAVAGLMKVARSKDQLETNPHMGWMRGVPEAQIKLLGVAELLGAVGLIVPAASGIAPELTRAAAAALAALMGGAAATHIFRRESGTVPAVLALLAIVVAAAR
jgi:uncharacterized membrane protein